MNKAGLKNTGTSRAYQVAQRNDENVPAGLAPKGDQVYSVRDICVAIFEIPSIFDTKERANVKIRMTGIGLVSLSGKSPTGTRYNDDLQKDSG